MTTDGKSLYLELIQRCLTRAVYREPKLVPAQANGFLKRLLVRALAARGLQLVRTVPPNPYDFASRKAGHDEPCATWFPHTMLSLPRLDNIQFCMEDVLAKGISGDFIETGVWRGGAVIFMRSILKAHGVTDRRVWAADSFQGFPRGNPEKYADDVGAEGQLAISLEEVRATFQSYGLLDDQVKFLPGWFCDTLPAAPINALAVARLDGDMYQSTMDALVNLYPKLSLGGYLIIDDYGEAPACHDAIADYRKGHNIAEVVRDIDGSGIYWQKTRQIP